MNSRSEATTVTMNTEGELDQMVEYYRRRRRQLVLLLFFRELIGGSKGKERAVPKAATVQGTL